MVAPTTAGWFVKFSEKVVGPFSPEQLQELAGSGVLTPEHLVSSDALDWIEAATLGGLTFGTTAPPLRSLKTAVTCVCGNSFDVLASYVGTLRPCPQCGVKCLVPSGTTADGANGLMPIQAIAHENPRPPSLFGTLTATGAGVSAALMALFFTLPWLLAERWYLQDKVLVQVVIGAILAVPAFVPMVVFLELRRGSRWAWFGIQIVAVAETGFCLLGFRSDAMPIFMLLSVGQIILYARLLPLLYSKEVQDYCFRARPS